MQEMQEMWVWSLDGEDPLEKEIATHSSILAWEIPWTGYSLWGCEESDMTEHTCRYTLQMPSTVPDQGLKVHAESLLTCSFMFGCIGSSLLHAGKWSFSLVVVHGFGCPMACEISPDQRLRIEPVSPVLAGGFLSTRPSGKSTCRSVGSLWAFPTSLISCSANSCCLSSLEFGSVHLSSSRLLCPVGFPSQPQKAEIRIIVELILCVFLFLRSIILYPLGGHLWLSLAEEALLEV